MNDKRFCELAGIEWHEISLNEKHCSFPGVVPKEPKYLCSCGCSVHDVLDNPPNKHTNPSFKEVRPVLEVMRKREDWQEFCATFFVVSAVDNDGEDEYAIPMKYLTPYATGDEAGKWMEERK